jgi:hypothetical protein
MARYDFRFAIDGFDLSEDESAAVAAKVQSAGLEALGELGHKSALGISISGGQESPINKYLLWRGYWLLHEGLLGNVLPQINESGLLKQIEVGVER